MECYTLETLGNCLNPQKKDLLDYSHLINCNKCLGLVTHTTNSLLCLGLMSKEVRLGILQNIQTAKEKVRKSINCDISKFYYTNNKEELSLSKLLNKQVVDLIIVPDSEYSIKAYYVVFNDGTKVDLYDGDAYISFRKLGFSEKFGFELYNQWRENME